MVEEDNSLSFGSTRFELRQRLSLPVGFSAFTMAAGIVFFWMALFGFNAPAFRFLYLIPAVAMFLVPLIYPIAHIDIGEHRVRFISIRLFGQWKKTVLDFQYEDVDRVECSGYPTTYGFRKEIYVVIQSLGQRIAAENFRFTLTKQGLYYKEPGSPYGN